MPCYLRLDLGQSPLGETESVAKFRTERRLQQYFREIKCSLLLCSVDQADKDAAAAAILPLVTPHPLNTHTHTCSSLAHAAAAFGGYRGVGDR